MNARVAMLCLSLFSTLCLADASGRRWPLPLCGTGCAMGTVCVSNRCVPEFRIATSIENGGGMTINPALSYATFVTRTQAAFAAWTVGRVS